ncbi:hypothetical protein RJG79_07295 [Mycoplasmatota bacterium WC44]
MNQFYVHESEELNRDMTHETNQDNTRIYGGFGYGRPGYGYGYGRPWYVYGYGRPGYGYGYGRPWYVYGYGRPWYGYGYGRPWYGYGYGRPGHGGHGHGYRSSCEIGRPCHPHNY